MRKWMPGLVLLTAVSARAATVTLDWEAVTRNADATPIADLAGYRVFLATYSLQSMTTGQAMASGTVTKVAAGNALTRAVTLNEGTTYYFRLTALDNAGNQSGFSELPAEVSWFASAAGSGGVFTPPAGLMEAYCFPNPAVGVDPVIRAFMGGVDAVEVTVFDQAGRAVHSGRTTFTRVVDGETAYEYVWTGEKATGIYYAVIHGKKGDETVRARVKFAVLP
jgi:hypothetical protein